VSGVDVVVALMMLIGLVGALLPFVPGTLLILGGALVHAIATGFTPIGPGRLVILAVLALVSSALGWIGGAVGARRVGGSRWAVLGALVGGVLGLAVPPVGLLVGPVVGAVAGEMLRGTAPAQSVRSGLGTLLGVIMGIVSHFIVALVMVGLFAWWVIRG
jgi:uncharacterized protein